MATNISFPTSPNINDTYTYSSTTFTWNGTTWGVAPIGILDKSVTISKLANELSGSAILGTGNNVIDFKAYIHYTKTLNSAWSPTFINPVKGKTITIIATGGAYTLTLPSSVKGVIDAWDGIKTNQLMIYCLDDSITPVYSVTLLNW